MDKLHFGNGWVKEMMARWVIVDLDGTLTNLDHRLHFVNRKDPDWESFFNACGDDSLRIWCLELIKSMRKNGFYISILSGRPRDSMDMTRDWLKRYHVPYDWLQLLGDRKRSDVDLKREWLKTQNKGGILFVVEDRKRVVDMWREEGLVCLQCSDWEEYHRSGEFSG